MNKHPKLGDTISKFNSSSHLIMRCPKLRHDYELSFFENNNKSKNNKYET